jgi:uncharacterized membrane protein YhaH (DUF805 family)
MRSVIGASVGLIYSLFLTLGGIVSTGMGHGIGTGIFMALALMPFPLVFWPTIAVMLTRLGSRSIKRYIIYMLVLHYLGFAIYLLALHSQDYQDFLTVWNSAATAWTWHVAIYLAGQIFIWWTLAFRKIRVEPRSAA